MSYRNGDFKPFFCQKIKRHIWVLGYFGGGSVNFKRFKDVAEDFSNTIGCSISSVSIDEITHSRRFKNFKFVFSAEKNQKPIEDFSEISNDVFDWLHD